MDKDTVFGTDDGTMTGKPVLNDKQSHIYWQNKCQEQGKEIESLRHNLEAASKETSRLSTELQDAVQALNDEERRGDEWKRMAKKMKHWLSTMYAASAASSVWDLYCKSNTEAAEWFEDKDE